MRGDRGYRDGMRGRGEMRRGRRERRREEIEIIVIFPSIFTLSFIIIKIISVVIIITGHGIAAKEINAVITIAISLLLPIFLLLLLLSMEEIV